MEFKGVFTHSELDLKSKLKNVKAFLFDWDGVFNTGFKNGQLGSGFSEVDSMGTNLLRFSYYLNTTKLPITGVISGEKNESAQFFANREHFDYNFYKIPHKIIALEKICQEQNIKPDEVCYFFDDVLDLSIAQKCGVRVLINKPAIHFFKEYCVKNNLVDYISHCDGGKHGIREACEMLMVLNDNFDKSISERTAYTNVYKEYINKRQAQNTRILTFNSTESGLKEG
ncbi:MAG: phosphatase [Bacteroidia bacterium]